MTPAGTFLILKHGTLGKAINEWMHNRIELNNDEWHALCEHVSELYGCPTELYSDIGGRRIRPY